MKKKTSVLIFLGILLGSSLVLVFQKVLHKTSTNEFCISCHTMQIPLQEYQSTVHFSNAKGIQAKCADCHIPQDDWAYLKTKFLASKDIYHQFITKKIDTPELYETHRKKMAETVWKQLKKNDSITCRTCHNLDAMNSLDQSKEAQKMHKYMQENNLTCIDCHKGIAHFLPENKVDESALNKLIQLAQNTPQDAQILYPVKVLSIGNLGKIAVATPLKVLDIEGKNRQVELQGYQMQGAEQVIYLNLGQRIVLANLTQQGQDSLKAEDWQQDSYGNNWRKVTLITTITADTVVDSQKPIWAYAEQLDNVYCATCHAKIPAKHFTANAWPAVAKSMGDRTAITPEELEILTKYFQFNAKDIVQSK